MAKKRRFLKQGRIDDFERRGGGDSFVATIRETSNSLQKPYILIKQINKRQDFTFRKGASDFLERKISENH